VNGQRLQRMPSGRLYVVDTINGGVHDVDVIVLSCLDARATRDAEVIRHARSAGQVIVVDIDDYLWALPTDHLFYPSIEPIAESARHLLQAASLVTVSTPFLSRALATLRPKLPVRFLVPNYVELDLWRPVRPGTMVGWVGCVHEHDRADFQIMAEGVVPWLRERGLPFYHGGALPHGPSARDVLSYDNVVTAPATRFLDYPKLWDPLRVALCPIAPGAFGHSKSWCKGLEACARGIPFISSDHPEYRALGVGRIAREPADWARHLDELQDPEVYAAECAASRRRAEQLSIRANGHRWEETLLAAAGGGP
jgi:hypothetical protein